MRTMIWVDAWDCLKAGDTWFLHTIAPDDFCAGEVLLPRVERNYAGRQTRNIRPAFVEKIVPQTKRALVRVLDGAEREAALDALGYAEVDLGR